MYCCNHGNHTMKNSIEKYGFYFLISVIILYLLLYIFYPQKTQEALLASLSLLKTIIPLLILVFIFMGIVNYLITPKTISKYLGKESGIKGWLIAVAFGIISHGSIYAYFPMLGELRKYGMRNALIAAFLYNRAIKIPLLPLLIYYFGATYVVVLTIYMIIASVALGLAIDLVSTDK